MMKGICLCIRMSAEKLLPDVTAICDYSSDL